MTDLALKFFSPADSERASRAPFLVPQAVTASVIAKKKNLLYRAIFQDMPFDFFEVIPYKDTILVPRLVLSDSTNSLAPCIHPIQRNCRSPVLEAPPILVRLI